MHFHVPSADGRTLGTEIRGKFILELSCVVDVRADGGHVGQVNIHFWIGAHVVEPDCPFLDGEAVDLERKQILHDLELGWPVIGGFAANRVIGPLFVANIAGKTLKRIKELSEARAPVVTGATM